MLHFIVGLLLGMLVTGSAVYATERDDFQSLFDLRSQFGQQHRDMIEWGKLNALRQQNFLLQQQEYERAMDRLRNPC